MFVDAANPWIISDSTVFRTEYGAIYAFSWLRELHGRYRLWYMPNGVLEVLEGCSDADGLLAVLDNAMNLRDLNALMVVEANDSWPKVPERCRAVKLLSHNHSLDCSRLGPGETLFILTRGWKSV